MQNFIDWMADNPSDLPWLLIGKGPSFNKIADYDTTKYRKLVLNHAITLQKAEICHVIDIDIIEPLAEVIKKNARFLLMPFYPHVDNSAGELSLSDWESKIPLLREMNAEKRLIWYNSSTSLIHKKNYPIIPVKFFSADAVVALLVSSGEKTLRSIGIDGGQYYSNAFDSLKEKTLLANDRQSFNSQFIAIANSLDKFGATLTPLGEESIKVFVGTTNDQWLATKVLEYSIKLHTSANVEVLPLCEANIHIPTPKSKKNQPRTPFSFQRFLIPQLCSHKGRAIYLDSDMQVFTDIRGLAYRDMKGQQVLSAWEETSSGRIPQYSVMLMDCSALNWDIVNIVSALDSNELNYEDLVYQMKIAERKDGLIEHEWNSLEHFDAEKTKLLHYTDMVLQPWLSKRNPLAVIWVAELASAIQHQFISRSQVKNEVFLGNVRPTLIFQLNTALYDPSDIPKYVSWADRLFNPPYRQTKWHRKNTLIKKIRGYVALLFIKLATKIYRIKNS